MTKYDVLIVDNCEDFARKPLTQKEFVSLMKTLDKQGKLLIGASLKQFRWLENAFCKNFEWGIMIEINKLSDK